MCGSADAKGTRSPRRKTRSGQFGASNGPFSIMCRCGSTFCAVRTSRIEISVKSFLACVLVLATALLVMDAQAQRRVRVPEAVLLPVDDGAHVYVERLQRRGLLRELNPTAAPYTLGELDGAL